jgi:hypothetical protein
MEFSNQNFLAISCFPYKLHIQSFYIWLPRQFLKICFIFLNFLSNLWHTQSKYEVNVQCLFQQQYSITHWSTICERTGPLLPGSVNWNKSFRNCQVKCKLPPKNDCRRELDHVKFYPEENRARKPTNVFILPVTTAQISFDENPNMILHWTRRHKKQRTAPIKYVYFLNPFFEIFNTSLVLMFLYWT